MQATNDGRLSNNSGIEWATWTLLGPKREPNCRGQSYGVASGRDGPSIEHGFYVILPKDRLLN